jgi:hypothetical protein
MDMPGASSSMFQVPACIGDKLHDAAVCGVPGVPQLSSELSWPTSGRISRLVVPTPPKELPGTARGGPMEANLVA